MRIKKVEKIWQALFNELLVATNYFATTFGEVFNYTVRGGVTVCVFFVFYGESESTSFSAMA